MTQASDNQHALQQDVDALASSFSDILLASLKKLAETGQAEMACRLAGRACVLLRQPQPKIARRFDVLLHRLTPKLTWNEPPDRVATAAPHGPVGANTKFPVAAKVQEKDR